MEGPCMVNVGNNLEEILVLVFERSKRYGSVVVKSDCGGLPWWCSG